MTGAQIVGIAERTDALLALISAVELRNLTDCLGPEGWPPSPGEVVCYRSEFWAEVTRGTCARLRAGDVREDA